MDFKFSNDQKDLLQIVKEFSENVVNLFQVK
jgi:hypothetical protein